MQFGDQSYVNELNSYNGRLFWIWFFAHSEAGLKATYPVPLPMSSVETKVRFYYLDGAGGLVTKNTGPLAKFGGLTGCRIVNWMPNPLEKTRTSIW